MKTHFLLFALLFLNSCAHFQNKQTPDQVQPPIEIPSAESTPSPSPIVDKKPSIKFEPITAWDSELQFINEGEDQANAVLKSDCFKSGVMTAKFTENLGLTNEKIYQKFVDASPMKVGITMFTGGWYERINNTVAYEGNPIRMNRRLVGTASYVGSTSLHEGFGHGLDFRHDYNKNYNTSQSIPYTLNRIFDKCAKALGFKLVY